MAVTSLTELAAEGVTRNVMVFDGAAFESSKGALSGFDDQPSGSFNDADPLAGLEYAWTVIATSRGASDGNKMVDSVKLTLTGGTIVNGCVRSPSTLSTYRYTTGLKS